MARSTTTADLNSLIRRLNERTGNPTEYISGEGDDRKINVGHFGLEQAYGGNKLVQVMNDRGGVRDVFSAGYIPKSTLRELIFAYIEGIRDAQDRSRLPNISI